MFSFLLGILYEVIDFLTYLSYFKYVSFAIIIIAVVQIAPFMDSWLTSNWILSFEDMTKYFHSFWYNK